MARRKILEQTNVALQFESLFVAWPRHPVLTKMLL